MIEVVGLRKSFGNVLALNDISFRVEKGQIVGFLGANGAGKTTTMDIICGCIGADAGTAKVAGFEISEKPLEVKKRIGYLPDEPPLHKEMRVDEYLHYAGRLHGLQGTALLERVNELKERLGLQEMSQRLIGNLSKGYKQRVGLAQALVHNPEVLILDEPTEGLDPNQILQIRELIKGLRGKHTILFSSHILSEVESVCDEIVIVDKGRVAEQGTHQQLIQRLGGAREYQLRVRQGAEALAKRLGELNDLSEIRTDNGAQLITFLTRENEQILDQVAQEVLQGGYGFKELAPKSKKLEDVFFQLTR